VNEGAVKTVNIDVKKGNKVKRKKNVVDKKWLEEHGFGTWAENGRKKKQREGKRDMDSEEKEESELETL
jgi:hypothetical protein